jgi:23S rRNA (uridine2552-2'-O)-methyltransferase
VYKLMEIQEKFRVLKKGQRVLDLGCAPGSWLLYAAEVCGPGGRVTGIDLKPVTIPLPKNAEALCADMLSLTGEGNESGSDPFQVVLSDMAPATSGSRDADAVRSLELCEAALAAADSRLKRAERW